MGRVARDLKVIMAALFMSPPGIGFGSPLFHGDLGRAINR